MHKTRVINLVAGPGAGKTTISFLLFAHIKLRKKVAEFAPEYAKQLVWKKEFDILNNQHMVSLEQYKLLKSMNGLVDYIVTDGPLIHGIYYNRYNKDNMSDVKKTEHKIMEFNNQFENIYIYLKRGNFEYETAGRIQTYDEALDIDDKLLHILDEYNIKYKTFVADPDNVKEMVDYCISF